MNEYKVPQADPNTVCYVTAFLDLDRDKWTTFSRSFDDYFSAFKNLVDLFSINVNKTSTPYRLIVFIDKKHDEVVRKYVFSKISDNHASVLTITGESLALISPLWARLGREQEIVEGKDYKDFVKERVKYPENSNGMYTLINHAKIDFLCQAIALYPDIPYFAWVDFGYFCKIENLSRGLIDVNPSTTKLDLTRINYTLLNPLEPRDQDFVYTLLNAPEKFGGFFFFGPKETLLIYRRIYHDIHERFQAIGIVDDDQHFSMQCAFAKPDLFKLHLTKKWHHAFQYFEDHTKYDLTEIMNRHGSDKGDGHHNYTKLYEHWFGPMRDQKLNVFELGIGTVDRSLASNMGGGKKGYISGASIRGWKEYFPNGIITGCDIDKNILFQEYRISTFFIDQLDDKTMEQLPEGIVPEDGFDIMIDDGLHCFEINYKCLRLLFKNLNKDGWYIIEDIKNFSDIIKDDPFLSTISYAYIEIDNPKNRADNNIFVARTLGLPINVPDDPIYTIKMKGGW